MPTMKEIKNHIKSVKATGKLAEAMKSISTAKYYRVSTVYDSFLPYADRSAEMLGGMSDPFAERRTSGKKCFVVLTGNRGLCGGYNIGLASFFEEIYIKETQPVVVVCGKWGAEYFRVKGIKSDRQFVFKDVPEYSESAALASYLVSLYSSGRVDEVIIVYQKFKNILTQVPETSVFLPVETKGDKDSDGIYYPDRETVVKEIYVLCLKNRLYSLLLESASGVQAATMMAMRTASDNAAELKAELDLRLNRKRQNQVTAGVIETSSSNEVES